MRLRASPLLQPFQLVVGDSMPENAPLGEQTTLLLMKTLRSMKFAAWVATVPAFLAAVTAVNVYLGEARRANFERLRYTHDAYSNYTNYLETKRGDHLRCLDYLADPKNISDEDFIELFQYKPKYAFQFRSSRHAGLRLCVPQEDAETLGLFDKPEWQEDDFAHFKRALQQHHGFIVTKLDAALIGYPREVADREVTCENFAAFLTSGVTSVNHGILGKFIARAIDRGLVRKDNFPNIYEFHKHIASLTANFESSDSLDCTKIPRKSRLQRFLEDLLG